jgi:prophage antirepressor-like protein
MADETGETMVLLRESFPVTGQPVRVVMINEDPWFVAADVCKVLERGSPHHVRKLVKEDEVRVVDLRSAARTSRTSSPGSGRTSRTSSPGSGTDAGRSGYGTGTPLSLAVSESGLYTLIMRSRKPAAGPFREWVTRELLPSVRRGDTDVAGQQARMAETLAEAVGQRVEVLAETGEREIGDGLRVLSDGTVHCPYGEMEACLPPEGRTAVRRSGRTAGAARSSGWASGGACRSGAAGRSSSWAWCAGSPPRWSR